MAYKRREPENKVCRHCKAVFESNHKSRIYCSSSCNTLSWMKRTGYNTGDFEESSPEKNELDFSLKNIAVSAAGAAAYDVAKFILSPPTKKGVTAPTVLQSNVDEKVNISLDLLRHLLSIQVKDDPLLAQSIEEDIRNRILDRNALRKIRSQKRIQ